MSLASRVVAGNTPQTHPANRVYFPALDGLRALAFLAVFGKHYGWLPFGWVGVDCFLALSGFLITGILYDTLDTPHHARNFYIRRTLRIFPLYYAVILVLVFAAPFAHWLWDSRWLLWPAYLGNWLGFFGSGLPTGGTLDAINATLRSAAGFRLQLGHFWSLCLEEQFYLIWPWVVFWVRDRRALLRICCGVILVCPLLRLLTIYYAPHLVWTDAIVHGTPFRIDTLLLGAAAALIYRGEHRDRLLDSAQPIAWIAALCAVISLHPPQFVFGNPFGFFLLTAGFSLIGIFSVAVLLRALIPGSPFYRFFSLRPLRWLGRISYGAYVFHDIPHDLFSRLTHSHRTPTALVALAFTLVLASLSFRFLESPFLRLKARFST